MEIDSNNDIHISAVTVGFYLSGGGFLVLVSGLIYVLNVLVGFTTIHLLLDWSLVCAVHPWYKLWGGCFVVTLIAECVILLLLCCMVVLCIGTTKLLKKYGIHIDWEDCNKTIPV